MSDVFISDEKKVAHQEGRQTWIIREGTCDSDKAGKGEEVRHFEEHSGCDVKWRYVESQFSS